jgi:hypothetical protein
LEITEIDMAKVTSVPMMITSDMERRLREAGVSQEAINKMTPQQAHDRLDGTHGAQKKSIPPVPKSDAVEDKKTKRPRSPNFPFINLERAIDQARAIYGADRRRDLPLAVACQRWGYKLGGSQSDQTVGALKAFGLIEVTGVGDGRNIRISDASYRILVGALDADKYLQEAALSPAIYRELWNKYKDDGIPENDVLRHYLLFERENVKFNTESVDIFIARFRETISFAKLDSSDKIRETEEGKQQENLTPEGEEAKVNPAQPVIEVNKPKPPPPPASGQKDFPLYLSNSKRAVLYIPDTITAKDYELLKRQIENHLAVIEATSIAEENANN